LPKVSHVLALSCFIAAPAGAQNQDFPPGDYSSADIIGQSLPGSWRPFSDDSPWNTPIPVTASTHPDSDAIIATAVSEASNLRLSNSYTPPIWVVNADNMPWHIADSPYPYDTWDQDLDGITEAPVPVNDTMWGENTSDGHITIIDPFRKLAWEMSRYQGLVGGIIDCSTFNVWDLTGQGFGDGAAGYRWGARGGRGSGFPVIAGLIRPEELEAGVIDHALVFIFSKNREDDFVSPPAARTDGSNLGNQFPMEGMRFQLDPSLTDADFDSWGLNREGKIVARALQDYGMYVGDNGGAMVLQVQLLDPDSATHRALWEALFPDFYNNVQNIPTSAFRVVDMGAATTGGSHSRVVAPLILPQGGTIPVGQMITISTSTSGAYITYTLDGVEPTETSTPYTGSFPLNASATVRARAFKAGMSGSELTRAPFWVEGDCSPMMSCPVLVPPNAPTGLRIDS
jgi:hypothetical protein